MGTFGEADKFDADGKAHTQEDELTNFADEQDASIRAQMLGVEVGVGINYPASEMAMEKRCKGCWNHRTTTTMMWREVWRRTTWRILPIRRLPDHACFEFLLLLSACVSTDNARCVFKWMLSNTIVTRDCEEPVFMVVFFLPRTLSVHPNKWQIRMAHQSNKCDECTYDRENDYTSYGRENNMTVYVKTISGKTIIVNCDKKQRAETIAETADRRAAIPRDMMFPANQGKVLMKRKQLKKTTLEMTLRL